MNRRNVIMGTVTATLASVSRTKAAGSYNIDITLSNGLIFNFTRETLEDAEAFAETVRTRGFRDPQKNMTILFYAPAAIFSTEIYQ